MPIECSIQEIGTNASSISSSLTCVTRCGLNDGVAGLELALLLGRFDDAESQPILDGRQGVEELAFCVDGNAIRSKSVNLDHGRVADGLRDVVDGGAVS